jgi:quercetin dioxygenase-like cupin family protein
MRSCATSACTPGAGLRTTCARCATAARSRFDQRRRPADSGRLATGVAIGRRGLAVEGAVLLADGDAIAVAEVRSAPDGEPPRPHVHARHVESFYGLAGELLVTAVDCDLRADAGPWVQVPPSVPHAVSFAGAEPARVLNLHTPSCGSAPSSAGRPRVLSAAGRLIPPRAGSTTSRAKRSITSRRIRARSYRPARLPRRPR